MNNIYRLLAILSYPLIVCFLLFYISYKYREVFIKYYKKIFLVLLLFTLIGTLAIFSYFQIEKNAIYVYDNAGYYVKSLEMLQIFYENPSQLFNKVYTTINTSDYSYLPSLFNFWPLLINNSYPFYCLINFYIFLLPTIYLLLLLYYRYYNGYLLPLLVLLAFYPLWITIFYGRVDVLGLLPLLVFYIITLFNNYEDINKLDVLILNFLTLLLMFERRWYLFALVGAYLAYMVKGIIYAYKNHKWLSSALKFTLSGLLALIILLIFFRGFFINVMMVNNVEAYAYYNHEGKVLAIINFFSLFISLVALYALTKLLILNQEFAISLIIIILIPTLLFFRTQSFDIHHYLIITLAFLFLFVYGLKALKEEYLQIILIGLLLIQSFIIFTPYELPLFTKTKKHIEENPYKEGLIDLSNYLKEISRDDGIFSYVATGNYLICDDAIKNATLPDIDFPNMVSYVFDIRDGFPRDFAYIKYFVISDPILYLDENYQHLYKVISDGIVHDEEVSKIFTLRNEFILGKDDDKVKVYIYELTGNYNEDIKEYFYQKMIAYYPDKKDFFAYILD